MQSALIKVTTNSTSFALSMVSVIVLARLLTPEEFGLLAMVTAVTEFARSFRELGLGTSTVQREEITHDEVSTLFWINFVVGLVLMLAMIGLSPVLVWFYDDTRLLHICMVLSSVFLFGGLTVQHRALLERQMRFGYLGATNMTSTALAIFTAILLALNGYGVWALVCRDVVGAAMYLVGIWFLCGWIPSLPKRKTDVRSNLRFGAHVSGYDIIYSFTRNLDRVLIGRFSGAISLGLYTRAFQLAMMPIEQIQIVFWDVGLSPLSALQSDPERYRRFYGRLLSVMTFFYMPFVVFIAIQSQDVIRLLLGEAWLHAAPLFRILAIAAFFRPIVATFQLVMISCGKTRRCLVWGTINGLFMIMAFGVGIFWGVVGIAYAYVIASYVSLMWSFVYCFKDTPVNTLLIVKNISIWVISSCGAGIILVSLLPRIPNTSVLASIMSSILVFAVAYFAILLLIPSGRQRLGDFWSYRTELSRRK